MPKELTLREHCIAQLSRIAHHGGFPKGEKAAIEDYICALMVAGTREGVTRVMDDIVGQVWDWVPSAAVLRGKAYEQADKPAVGCAECEFTGWKQITRGGMSGVIECACRHNPERERIGAK